MSFLLISNFVVTLASCIILNSYFIKEDEVSNLKEIISEKNCLIELYKIKVHDLEYELLCKTPENTSSK